MPLSPWFCCWIHPLRFLFQLYFQPYNIHLVFLYTFYFFAETFYFFGEAFYFFFICFKHVHNCSLKSWPLKNLCQIILTSLLSRCWYLWIAFFFHSIWDISGSWYDKWFSIEAWAFGIMFWDSGFYWNLHHSGKSRIGATLLLTNESTNSGSPLGLHLTQKVGRAHHYCWVRSGSSSPPHGLHQHCAGAGDHY